MCEFCVQHGEGKKWYLLAKNYTVESLRGQPRRGMTDNLQLREENMVRGYSDREKMIASGFEDARAKVVAAAVERRKSAFGQMLPLEDALLVLDLTSSIVRLSCICRTVRGVHNARYCLGLNLERQDIQKVMEYPDYARDFEVVEKSEAKKLLRQFEMEGLVHLVFSQAPFVLGMCNCDATYCGGLRARARYGSSLTYFKTEYVSTVDWDKCNGCRDCMKMCHSGAISYSPASKKCVIDQFKCWGTGLCRQACLPNAITFHDRNSIPALAKEW